jgi:beta-N-acetylhexosaminidase
MTAHIVYRALDPENPATLSKRILSGLLREWGYDGVIVTDSMGMKAIADNYPAGQAALRSVLAGADIVLALGRLETQIQQVEALAKAIASGEISAQRLEASYRRLDRLTQQFPGKPKPYSAYQEAQDRALMDEASYRSITAIGEGPLPNPADRILLVIPEAAVGENVYEPGPQAEKLAQAMSKHFSHLEVLAFPREHPEFVRHELEKTAKHADFLLYASTSRHSLKSEEIALAKAVFQQGKPALHLALWNPYHVAALDRPALITYGFRQPSLKALAEVLAGKPALGRLPVGL